jgi:DeoR/GlpR family transcriptional regulator of sugar metabolism/ABC-type sugar transport system substrate-binding protein
MIKDRRHQRILEILASEGSVEIAELSRIMPEVSQVTLRRDITELAEAGALKRTHGGAILPDRTILRALPPDPAQDVAGVDDMDAVVLPPFIGRGGDALRRHILRRGIPYLAESAPQPGGVYLGPNNRAAGFELGALAGREAAGWDRIRLLMIGLPELENTRERAEGFREGLRSTFRGALDITSINSQGSYRVALRVATDAFASGEPFDMIFAVNDHAAIAGAEAAAKRGAHVALYATGGENPNFVAQVAANGPLRAVAAFFPEVVGTCAVDRLAVALAEGAAPAPSTTPHVIITPGNLRDFYIEEPQGWRLRDDRRAEMVGAPPPRRSGAQRARIGFMPHFPAHDWYRAMIPAMQFRAAELRLEIVVTAPHHGISAEISRLRLEIARLAASTLSAGETIVLGEGEATLCLASELRRIAFSDSARLAGLTVITNSLDILHRLEGSPGVKTLLTSGEYQAADRCLVGPSLGALFERLRADRAFLSVAGISPRFGASALDERLALAASRLGGAARRVVALADHTLVGAEANHRICRIEDVHLVITDDGTMAADRQSLRAAGIEVLVAGEDSDQTEPQTLVSPGWRTRERA